MQRPGDVWEGFVAEEVVPEIIIKDEELLRKKRELHGVKEQQ